MSVYLFTREGKPLLAAPADDRLPLDPAQVEGVLALAGEFDAEESRESPLLRARYDTYGILGLRGEHAVLAAVTRDTPETVLLPELERFLRRCDRRLRRGGLD